MSSRCLATDALMLAPWKIFPGVCSFMHCCTTGVIKLFPWRKAILNQRHVNDRIPRVATTMAEVKKKTTIKIWVYHHCYMFIQSMLGKSHAVLDILKYMNSPAEPGTGQPFQRQSNLRCSPTWSLISISEATSTIEGTISLKCIPYFRSGNLNHDLYHM